MKSKIIFTLVLFISISYEASALNATLQKKYPYSVLTDDHGILNSVDLNSFLDGVSPPVSPPRKGYGYIYWQCFPRQQVKISLEDTGYSSISHSENDAEITITAYSKKNIIHKYGMRRNWPFMGTEDRFNQYVRLMQAEKHVCIAGNFIQAEDNVTAGQKYQTHYWVFEKMKTKNGCESYFENGCHYRTKRIDQNNA